MPYELYVTSSILHKKSVIAQEKCIFLAKYLWILKIRLTFAAVILGNDNFTHP